MDSTITVYMQLYKLYYLILQSVFVSAVLVLVLRSVLLLAIIVTKHFCVPRGKKHFRSFVIFKFSQVKTRTDLYGTD